MADFDTSINIERIMLYDHSGAREANIKEQVLSIDLYESILSPIMYCEIKMQDPIDLLNGFPILGEEIVEFKFGNKDNLVRNIRMKVCSVADKKIDEQRSTSNYTLKLVSEDLFKASSYTIQRKYDRQISDIVQNLMGEITQKKISVEATKGIEKLTIPQMKPMIAIDWLRQRAVSPEYKSSSYCFFENKDGFNFKTLEGLFKEGKDKVGDKIFFFDSNQREDIRTVKYRNVLAYQHIRLNKSIDSLASGSLKNSITQYDIITGEVKKKIYEDPDFEGLDSRIGSMNSRGFKTDFMEGVTKTFFTFTDSSIQEEFLPEKISYLQSFANRISQNLMWIWVNGDSAITAGDVIQCNIPKNVGTTETEKDRLYSGNYLVAKLRHIIQVNGADCNYTQSAELIKGSVLSG